jgi:hypothetical protein
MNVLAPPCEGKPAKDNPYASQHFTYNPGAQTVACPQSRTLDYKGGATKSGHRVERFRCHHHDCPVRAHCTGDPKGRQIEVWPHTATVQAMRARLQTPLWAGPVSPTQPDHRAALWTDQTTGWLSSMDGVGFGKCADPMVALVRDFEPESALPTMENRNG